MKKFENVLSASKQEAIPFVANGLVVEADGFLLSEDGLANIDAALEISAAAEAENATLNAAVQNCRAGSILLIPPMHPHCQMRWQHRQRQKHLLQ